MKLNAQNAYVVKLGAYVTDLEKQPEQSAFQVHVVKLKYLLLYVEAQKLKQRLVTDVSCNAEMEQSSMNASKNVLGYMDALHLMVVKSEVAVRESFRGSYASLVLRLQTLFTQEVAAVSKSADDSVWKALFELFMRISQFEAGGKGRLDRLVGGNLAFSGIGDAIPRGWRDWRGKWGGSVNVVPNAVCTGRKLV